jgi:putative oxidoreductase
MSHHDLWINVLARCLLVIMFPFSAIDKAIHWDDAIKQAGSSFLPGAPLLLVAAMGLELLAPLCVALDWHARIAALFLASFCVATALMYHPFWRRGDFWAQGESIDRTHFWDFTKNLGLAGGLLLVAMGAGLTPVS